MPRILFVTAHCPHGASYGARLRALHIARILKGCGTIGMVLMPYGEVDAAHLRAADEEFDLRAVLYCDQPFPKTLSRRLRRELDPHCAETQGYGLSAESAATLERIRGGYDLIWFHGILIPNSLSRPAWPCSVLDIDDVQSQVHAGRAVQGETLAARFKGLHQSMLWRRRERALPDRFGIVCVCSEKDKHYLGGGARIHVIPNGFEAPPVEPRRSPVSPPQVGFIGTLRYAPNIDGLRWFIRKVWPLIKEARADARLRLVGAETDGGIAAEGPDIDGLGFLDDVAAEVAGWSTSIVPIHVGGGTRIKIAEAFSRKCPVVSTRLGAYGYRLDHGRECMLADSSAEFAAACLRLMDERAFADGMADRAWNRFGAEWSWDAIAPRVRGAVEACLATRTVS